MVETIEQLLASVRLLREEYEHALLVRKQLIEARRRIAGEIRQWARDGCNHAPAALRPAERDSD
jgi:hypothetical protein